MAQNSPTQYRYIGCSVKLLASLHIIELIKTSVMYCNIDFCNLKIRYQKSCKIGPTNAGKFFILTGSAHIG